MSGKGKRASVASRAAMAGATAAVGSAVGSPPLSGSLAVLNVFAQRIFDKAQERQRDRIANVAQELGARLSLADAPERQVAVLDEYLTDDNRADAIVQAFQSMLDAVSATSWPCVAAITAEYVHHGRPTDGFYRDVIDVLTTLDDEGLIAAEALLSTGLKHPRSPIGQPQAAVMVDYKDSPEPRFRLIDANQRKTIEEAAPAPGGVRRAARVLADKGFAWSAAHGISLETEAHATNATRLLHLLTLREGRDDSARAPAR